MCHSCRRPHPTCSDTKTIRSAATACKNPTHLSPTTTSFVLRRLQLHHHVCTPCTTDTHTHTQTHIGLAVASVWSSLLSMQMATMFQSVALCVGPRARVHRTKLVERVKIKLNRKLTMSEIDFHYFTGASLMGVHDGRLHGWEFEGWGG